MTVKILLIIIAVLLPDWLLWKTYFRGRKPGSWLWWVPSILLGLCALGAIHGGWHSFFMRATYFLVMFTVIPKLAYLTFFKLNRKLAAGMVILTLSIMVYGLTVGFYRLGVRQETYESKAVPPSFDGYRIVHLSDFHIGTFSEGSDFIGKIVDSVKALKPDLVVMTGDLVNILPSEVTPFMKELSEITAPDGVFAVMGNHDYGFKKDLADRNAVQLDSLTGLMGWKMLNNSNALIKRGCDSLYIIGVENISRSFFVSRGDLSKAMEDVPEKSFKILLTHDPHHWDDEVVPDTDIDLTLTGHTHAMQFKVARISPAMFMFKHWSGKYISDDGRMLNVSEGLGGIVPFRFGAWPEIVVITLKRNSL